MEDPTPRDVPAMDALVEHVRVLSGRTEFADDDLPTLARPSPLEPPAATFSRPRLAALAAVIAAVSAGIVYFILKVL